MRTLDIAVIVTCWNQGRFLEESLASVERQTRPASEKILVDDGSEDPLTLQVLSRIEKAGAWKVIRRPNGGVSAARNHGFSLSSAPLVVFLDGDDIFDERWLEKASLILEEDPGLDFVSSAMRAFGDADYSWSPPQPELVESICFGVPHVSSLMRRTVFEAVGGFDEKLRSYEELDFWTRVLAAGFSGTVLEDVELGYRVSGESLYRRAIREHQEGLEAFYRRREALVREKWKELLLRREAFILAQRDHQRHVQHEKQELEAQIERVNQEIIRAEQSLLELGQDGVNFGDLRRLRPISPWWGLDRGRPLDRYYIEDFLERHATDIRGRVLEIKDPGYTKLFGGDRVEDSQVLDINPANTRASLIGDLSRPGVLKEAEFDCFILTQTLNIIYDFRSALSQAIRALRPGGVLLCTVSALNRISYEDGGLDGDYWRFTEASLRKLFSEFLPPEHFEISGYGNVLACTAFLQGLAIHEFKAEELEEYDPYFPLVYGIRALRPKLRTAKKEEPRPKPLRRQKTRASVFYWHRVAHDTSPDPWNIRVSPEVLRSQLEDLRNRCRILPLVELLRKWKEDVLDEDSVALSFDDGYLDNLEEASRVLLDLELPATFFLTGLGWEHPDEFWWDRLVRLMYQASGEKIEIAGESFSRRHCEGRPAGLDDAWEMLSALGAGSRDLVLGEAFDRAGLACSQTDVPRPMLAQEIRELSARPGHDIGAHTQSHGRLLKLRPEEQRREIVENRDRLEALLGRPVSLLAYPFGEHDPLLEGFVESQGFEAAFTVEGRAFEAGDSLYGLPRIEAPVKGKLPLDSPFDEESGRNGG